MHVEKEEATCRIEGGIVSKYIQFFTSKWISAADELLQCSSESQLTGTPAISIILVPLIEVSLLDPSFQPNTTLHVSGKK